ncbi:MAG: YhdH/YhfP family quinone oxidoreductase [Gammaproteobacteria bacterium]|nr:YhdH/YhfP family quinone oxidoreductase [Gammaproteobacteria bacterium]MBT5153903.1 YhdH/YhfP family quinone oxidoreductase [Gammaproteobacteria bacterium]MBT5684902.1 YhdH/YhfP family quinone oxidoreductase [Gammaproteobacteria bacterium]MBT5724517.1 YhdH/YhfP family quinone oxidoreductase [Gammaproteobacteria bacterium]MBT6893741.1 YhdH/YhfP family quinone oxidoreductase [Gammaproteobacteria bacterium]
MTSFSAFWVEKSEDGVTHQIIERTTDDLPDGDVLINVHYSSLNYKDALSSKGLPGVTKSYPHTPGIDAAGQVVESNTSLFEPGDNVVVIGFDLGMNTPGGYGQLIRVPASWITPLPAGMTLRESMIIGTAGLTAALCYDKLLKMGAKPSDGPVVVTGATGGVGSVAVALLAKEGFDVVASSGKADKADYLKGLGAKDVIDRESLSEQNPRPMDAMKYAHGIDTVGGEILTNVIKGLSYGGSVAICGLVASPAFTTTVLPFILRNVNILGIDSVSLPIEEKTRVWNMLAADWKLSSLDEMVVEIGLNQLSGEIDKIFAGGVAGRTLVKHEVLG